MATQFKFTIARGAGKKSVTVAAGDVVGTDLITLNIDATNMTQGDALRCIEELKRKILETAWFPL
jgi:hypothetical protein